jgi:subtilisin family serine protease
MNGNTTIISNGADLAARKGIIVTNSAGNSGLDAWHYIIAPADADSILAVGAVNSSKVVASFSSYGPTADGRIKPNVASVGWGTIISNAAGVPVSGNGTSFSNPNLAGLVACLWQAFPEFSNMDIIDAVQRSADHFANPDDRVGYGIPDFEQAYQSLLSKRKSKQVISAFPVPFKDQLTVNILPTTTGAASLQLVNASGQLIQSRSLNVVSGQFQTTQLFIKPGLSRGVYYLVLREGKNKHTISIIK